MITLKYLPLTMSQLSTLAAKYFVHVSIAQLLMFMNLCGEKGNQLRYVAGQVSSTAFKASLK